jgi:hypothetical protein
MRTVRQLLEGYSLTDLMDAVQTYLAAIAAGNSATQLELRMDPDFVTVLADGKTHSRVVRTDGEKYACGDILLPSGARYGSVFRLSGRAIPSRVAEAVVRFKLINPKTGVVYSKGLTRDEAENQKSNLWSARHIVAVIAPDTSTTKKDPNELPDGDLDRMNEDAPANSVGTGNIAGAGVGPQGEPGVKRKKFAGHEVFEVDDKRYHDCRMGKRRYHRYERYVGSDELGTAIREYGRTNPGKPIIVQNSQSGAMMYLRYGRRKLHAAAGFDHHVSANGKG